MSAVSRLATALADRYRIERELGQGGMATVYLAADLKHDRKVAIKVLKPELAAVLGAERFVQEIKTTAALSHPHILPLFDSGEAGGFLYYVMPYLQGETVREKLNRETQFGIDEAIRITTEVADALDYAHRNGVIHRDIKPENILLYDGRPMVMDFGIALAVSAAAGGRMTETGLSLGTPHYMSPEQATADKTITARSDIYSLASVLYEMLTGNPPHTGASAQQIIMKIIAEEAAPVTSLRKAVPAHAAAAVGKALQKLPADRFDSAKTFAEALHNPAFTVAELATGPAAIGAANRRLVRLAIGLAIGLLLALVAALWGWLRPAPPRPVVWLPMVLPDSAPLTQQFGSLFALSEDGSEIVYVGPGVGDIDLWRRPLDGLSAMRVPETSGADSPFLSPDGETIVFYRAGPSALYAVSLRGGPRRTLVSDSLRPLGGDFSPDGRMIYFVREGGIRRLPLAGGPVEEVSRVDTTAGEQAHGWIDVLPDGNGAVVTILRPAGAGESDIAALDLRSGHVTILFRGTSARYANGYLLYADAAGGLFAVRFDPDAMQATGNPIPIVATVTHDDGQGPAHFAVTATGTLLYGTGAGTGNEEVVWVDRAGQVQPVDSALRGSFVDLALSPDGGRLALTQNDREGSSVWIKELDHGPLGKLTLEGESWGPAWTRDGRSVTFTHFDGGVQELNSRRADGSINPTVLLRAGSDIDYGVVSPDGQWILYQTDPAGSETGRDIFAHRLGPDTSTVAVAASPAGEVSPRLSPDGRWLAYGSNESGRPEVYVSPFPDTRTARIQVSADGGAYPVWARNGRELFYWTQARTLIDAEVETTPTFRVRDRKPLFTKTDLRLGGAGIGPQYDISPDGQRFIMLRRRGGSTEQLILVQNWPAGMAATGRR